MQKAAKAPCSCHPESWLVLWKPLSKSPALLTPTYPTPKNTRTAATPALAWCVGAAGRPDILDSRAERSARRAPK